MNKCVKFSKDLSYAIWFHILKVLEEFLVISSLEYNYYL